MKRPAALAPLAYALLTIIFVGATSCGENGPTSRDIELQVLRNTQLTPTTVNTTATVVTTRTVNTTQTNVTSSTNTATTSSTSSSTATSTASRE